MYLTFGIAALGLVAWIFVSLKLTPASSSVVQPATPAAQPAPVLGSVSAHFVTGAKGKHGDTKVGIKIEGPSGEQIAELKDIKGHFHVDSPDGPYELMVSSRPPKSEMPNWTSAISIKPDPNKHEKWDFTYSLTFRFSDGGVRTVSFRDVSLSSKHPSDNRRVQ
jgi:hypothetical protein